MTKDTAKFVYKLRDSDLVVGSGPSTAASQQCLVLEI